MSIKRMLVIALLVSIVLVADGCYTFYYKQFVAGGTPHYPDPAIQFPGLLCFFYIDTDATNEEEYRDSTYHVHLSLLRDAVDECGTEWQAALESAELGYFTLSYDGVRIEPQLKSDGRRTDSAPCRIQWWFEDIVIPEGVDTLVVDILLRYTKNGEPVDLDTVVNLIRMEGKEKEMAHF